MVSEARLCCIGDLPEDCRGDSRDVVRRCTAAGYGGLGGGCRSPLEFELLAFVALLVREHVLACSQGGGDGSDVVVMCVGGVQR